jgi:probable addiction module antidote protein
MMKKHPASVPYEKILHNDLKDPNTAVEYLNACLEDIEHPNVFLIALRDVAKSWGFTDLSEQTGLNRESLYRMLSEKGNPSLISLLTVLDAMNLSLSVKRKKKPSKA